MQYQITSDNIELSPSMENLAMEKTSKLVQKLVNVPEDLRSLRIVMNKVPDEMFLVKILLTIRGKEYFTEDTEYTLESGLVKVVDDLERMLERDKAFSTEQEWKDAREAKRLSEEDLDLPLEDSTPLEEAVK